VDIALGVSMTPVTVRLVLVEGEKADGVTVDHDVFDIAADSDSANASDRVVAAILGTRESAAEGGHRLISTGVTWRNHDDAARLRKALRAHNIHDVMLVSELHAAGALAQAAGAAVGYRRTALMFVDGDTATLSVVETSDGSIVRVERRDLHTDDAASQLTSMVAALERLDAPPQGVFVVGPGDSVNALKVHLESATSLPVSAPDEPGLALARGAALASTRAPLFEASTVVRAIAQDGHEGSTARSEYAARHAADPGALAYSEVEPDDEPAFADPGSPDAAVGQPGRKPFLLVGSTVTGIFVLGVAALVVSLAVSIRPTVGERPPPAESLIVPTQAPAPAAAVPTPPAAPPETIQAPVPVVQASPQPQAPPRTVFVAPPAAVQAPAPAPAAVAPAPAPAAVAPAPAPAAVAPPVVAPPVVAPVIPAPIVVPRLPIINWPWERHSDYPKSPGTQKWPQEQHKWPQWEPPKQDPPQWDPPVQKWPQWDPPQKTPQSEPPVQEWPQWDPPPQKTPQSEPPGQQWPQWDPPKQSDPQLDPPKQSVPQWDPPKQSKPSRGSDNPGGSDRGAGGNGGELPWPWPNNGGGD
jgi:hypothetical protein